MITDSGLQRSQLSQRHGDYSDCNDDNLRASITIEMHTLMDDIDYSDHNDYNFNNIRAASVTVLISND